MANNSQYFQHDYFSRHDPKIKKLKIKYGKEAVCDFWEIVEMLHEQGGYLESDYELIAFELQSECERIKDMIENSGLFIVEDGKFTSERVQRNFEKRAEKSEKAKLSALARWGKEANAMRPHSKRNAIKEKKRKEKEIKKDYSAIFWSDFDLDKLNTDERRIMERSGQEIVSDYKRVLQLEEPLTADQFYKAANEYGVTIAMDAIRAMHNYAELLKKYKSANLTMQSWCRRRKEGK